MRGSQWCLNHDPSRAAENRRRSSRGGRTGGRGRPQNEVREIKQKLSDLADGVLSGDVDRSDGAIVSQILNVYLRALSTELKIREALELEARLESLEDAINAQRSQGRHYR
jgi:hypothetical protein